ncbi:MAG: hypothetical protein B6D61_04530 [Bacteroidetes bacterium 4484_249]|nr:MAG: hypothetical protein B6D61_04530 [Bacteroidetes bacterium 4484_249]
MLLSFVPQDKKTTPPWEIPAEFLIMKNPQPPDDAGMIKVGKMLYAKHCKSCHGPKGAGDGPKAKNLDTFPGDFTVAGYFEQSDGELFYKSIIGRDEMPNYEKKIPDIEDQWAIITYIRAKLNPELK